MAYFDKVKRPLGDRGTSANYRNRRKTAKPTAIVDRYPAPSTKNQGPNNIGPRPVMGRI